MSPVYMANKQSTPQAKLTASVNKKVHPSETFIAFCLTSKTQARGRGFRSERVKKSVKWIF